MTREQFDVLFPECAGSERMDVPLKYFHERLAEFTPEDMDIAFPAWRRVLGQIRQLSQQKALAEQDQSA